MDHRCGSGRRLVRQPIHARTDRLRLLHDTTVEGEYLRSRRLADRFETELPTLEQTSTVCEHIRRFLYFTDQVPVPGAARFNFTYDFGGGV